MNEIVINFALVVAASVYCGMLIGKRGVRKEVDKAVAATLEEVREREQMLAAELHGELGKVRESIIASARAYQSAVRAIDTKLAPPAAFTLGDKVMDRLPETLENGDALELDESDSDDLDHAQGVRSPRSTAVTDAGSLARSKFILGATAARDGAELSSDLQRSDFRNAIAQSRATATGLTDNGSTGIDSDTVSSAPDRALPSEQVASSDSSSDSIAPTAVRSESTARDSFQALSVVGERGESETELRADGAEEILSARSVG